MATFKNSYHWFPEEINKETVREIHVVKNLPNIDESFLVWDPTVEEDNRTKAIYTYQSGKVYISTEGADYIYAHADSSYMFSDFENVNMIEGLNLINTENVYIMKLMFCGFGYYANELTIDLSGWDTHNVRDMRYLFVHAGQHAVSFHIIGLDEWNVSNVKHMSFMFYGAGRYSHQLSLGALSNWDVSKVENMNSMFESTGEFAEQWSAGNLEQWNVNNVTNMNNMFHMTGAAMNENGVGNLENKWGIIMNYENFY